MPIKCSKDPSRGKTIVGLSIFLDTKWLLNTKIYQKIRMVHNGSIIRKSSFITEQI